MDTTLRKNVDKKLRDLIRHDRDLQIAIAQEINIAVNTVYHWAAYHPERLAMNRAALRVANRYMKKIEANC